MAKYPEVCKAIADAMGGDPPPIGAIRELAIKLKRDQSVVGRWVGGKSSPDSAAWPDIEAALDMPPGTLKAAALTATGRGEAGDRTLLLEELAEIREQMAQLGGDVVSLAIRVAAIERGSGASGDQRSQSDE